MENMSVKIKIVVLWLFMAITYSAHMALSIFEPGVVNQIAAGKMQIDEGTFVFSTLFAWIIPLTMAFLSLVLKDPVNRRTNVILGIVITVGNLFHLLFEQVAQPSIHMARPSVHQLLLNLSTVVVTAFVVWYAWRWPVRKA
jgi:hypothetical protein